MTNIGPCIYPFWRNFNWFPFVLDVCMYLYSKFHWINVGTLIFCSSCKKHPTSVIFVAWPVPIVHVFFQADERQACLWHKHSQCASLYFTLWKGDGDTKALWTTESINKFSHYSQGQQSAIRCCNLQCSIYVEQRVRCYETQRELWGRRVSNCGHFVHTQRNKSYSSKELILGFPQQSQQSKPLINLSC